MKVSKIWVIIPLVIVLGIGTLVGCLYLQKNIAEKKNNTANQPIEQVETTTETADQTVISENLPTSTLLAGEDMSLKAVKYTELPKDLFSQNFQWQVKEKVANLGVFVNYFDQCLADTGPGCIIIQESQKDYYKIANFIYNNKQGDVISVKADSGMGYGESDYNYYFIKYDGKIILLKNANEGTEMYEGDGLNKNKFLINKVLYLPTFNYPKTILHNKENLYFESISPKEVTDEVKKVFDPKDNTTVFQTGENFTIYIDGIHPVHYNIRLPAYLQLNNGKRIPCNIYETGHVGEGACNGGIKGLEIKNYSATDLLEIGVSENDNKVFVLKNNNDPDIKKIFEDYNNNLAIAIGKPTTTYDKFLSEYPLLVVQDGFGRFIKFKNKNYYFQYAECGKPVIYLYPTKDTNINVKVQPNGGFSKTEPTYLDNGWNVRATPQSDIFNYADNTSYPYLFWEGKAYDMTFPDAGFVMKKENVGTQMRAILSNLGLVEKEINDFLEFWQPKLEVKPYVYVTFLPQKDFDRLAPLTITPKPDKTIRVFMDYQPLENSITVRPLHIITPTRTGFTVVEWGGRLHK
ncbi:MAG: hypothetical protein WCT11_03835 [Candidatus Magasanikbacteria bacterium]